MKDTITTLIQYLTMGSGTDSIVCAVVELSIDEYAFFSQCHGLTIGGTDRDMIAPEQVHAQGTIRMNLDLGKDVKYLNDLRPNYPYVSAWKECRRELSQIADIPSETRLIITIDFTPY